MKILIPLPRFDFDPTEVAIPWALVTNAGHEVRFSTPDAKPGEADPRMTTGEGLGILKRLLMADRLALKAYGSLMSDWIRSGSGFTLCLDRGVRQEVE